MSAFSDYMEGKVLDAIFEGTSFPTISSLYVAAFETDPGDDGAGTECSWSGYSRVEVAPGTGWTRTDNTATNAAAITFPAQGSPSSVTVSWIGIYDASSGGNLIARLQLDVAKVLAQTDVLEFSAGQVSLTLD